MKKTVWIPAIGILCNLLSRLWLGCFEFFWIHIIEQQSQNNPWFSRCCYEMMKKITCNLHKWGFPKLVNLSSEQQTIEEDFKRIACFVVKAMKLMITMHGFKWIPRVKKVTELINNRLFWDMTGWNVIVKQLVILLTISQTIIDFLHTPNTD